MENKENIFKRFINSIKNIFKKEEIKQIPQTTQTKDNNSKSDFINDIKLNSEEDSEVLKLQEQYEKGELKLSDLSDEQLHRLNLLYKKQVIDLEKKLECTKTELVMAKYKMKSYSANA